MKYNPEAVKAFGELVLAAFMDVFLNNKMPNMIMQMGGQRMRMVLMDNTQRTMTKQQVIDHMEQLKAKKTDVGFSYTAEGLRIIVVPEEMTFLTSGGITPIGTGSG